MTIEALSMRYCNALATTVWKSPRCCSLRSAAQRISAVRHIAVRSGDREPIENKPLLNFLFDATGRIVYKVHDIWREHLQVGDLVVDATCGNGGDTWEVCQAVLGPKSGWGARFGDVKTRVVAVDIQQQAIDTTRGLLEHNSDDSDEILQYVQVIKASHEDLLDFVPAHFIGNTKLVVFNLGYLPRGDKNVITLASTTIKACEASLQVLKPGGLVSILAYVGHEGGEEEFQAVIQFSKQLDPFKYHTQLIQLLTRPTGPHFIGIYKR